MSGMVRIEGFKELEAALGELPVAFRREVILKAWKKAGAPMVQEAKTRAHRQANPRRRGGHKLGSRMAAKYGLDRALADSIALSAVKKNAAYPSETAAKLGPDAGHYYGLWEEKGTKASGARGAQSRAVVLRRSRKTGELKLGVRRAHKAKRGHAATPAHRFLEPAFQTHAERTAKAVGEELWKEIASKARSLARSAEKGRLSAKAREGLLE